MKKLLLIATLALIGQQLRGDDMDHLDLFAALGVTVDCTRSSIQQAVMAHKKRAEQKVFGPDADYAGYLRNVKLIGDILMVDNLRVIYFKWWYEMREKGFTFLNPFKDHPHYVSELGGISLSDSLFRLEQALLQFLSEPVQESEPTDIRPGSTPPVNIPPSPVMGRRSRMSSDGSRPLSRTEEIYGEYDTDR